MDLPHDLKRYFKVEMPGTIEVELSTLRTIRARPDGIRNAAMYMRRAYDGEMDRRKPISLRDNADGTYEVLDGNSTTAVARAAAWPTRPAQAGGDLQPGCAAGHRGGGG